MSEFKQMMSIRVFRRWEPGLTWLGRDQDEAQNHFCNSEFH